MGKSEKSNDTSTGIPQSHNNKTNICQKDDQKPSKKIFCIKSLVNLLIYVICILSLSISLYLSYRHHELASNVKSLMYLDNKVARIEIDLNDLIQKTNRLQARRDSIITDTDDDDDDNDEDGEDFVNTNMPVHHVFGELSRLKRDVSNLKIARRQRQTGAQSPNENCLCPPGESLDFPPH